MRIQTNDGYIEIHCGLKENGLHRLTGSGYGLVGVGVALLEEVYHTGGWGGLCGLRCSGQAQCDSFSSTMSACMQASMLLAMTAMNKTSEPVSLPQLNIFLRLAMIKESLHAAMETLTKTNTPSITR